MPDHPVPHPDLADYVLGTLGEPGAERFAGHLRDCDRCRREVEDLAPLRARLDEVLPVDGAPPGLTGRTVAAVGRVALASPRSGAPSGRPARARRVAPVAAAVLVVALGGLVVAGPWRTSAPSGRQIALVAAPGAEGSGVAHLRRSAAGIEVRLDLAGLAVPVDGAFYECWYVAADDRPDRPARLSAGTFLVAPGGSATTRMITAADPARYPGIEVTLEPGDGDPARTGPVVLRSRAAPGP